MNRGRVPETPPPTEAFQRLLLDMAEERATEQLLELVAGRFRDLDDVALARIWILEPGDICDECHLRAECLDRSRCLHLVTSAGSPLAPEENWDGIDGRFRRFPVGVRKIGHIAAHAEPVEVVDIDQGSHWIADPAWAIRERIRGFVGQPLVHRDEVIGVIGVFLRVPLVEDFLAWLRTIADHLAIAIVNSRAFQEIECLRSQLSLENEYLRDEVRAAQQHGDIIGSSGALAKTLQQVELVAPTESNVLILGESGVGKELIARAIHEQSARSEGPMISVNCASIPAELFESEFFGHLQGSFTGAAKDRVGRFELASGGTLFLDEVGEIPIDLQGKLLRVLQEGTFERIGDEATRTADVRLIAATNRDLEEEVEAGRFRQDLFYRLSVFPVEVAPLRDRKDDIPALTAHFLEHHSRRLGIPLPKLTNRHVVELQRYDWPGNIRELQNAVERAVIRARVGPLRFETPDLATANSPRRRSKTQDPGTLLTEAEMRETERSNLLAVLEHHNWKISGTGGAAEFLGLHPATLSSRLRALGIRRPATRAT